MLDRIGCRNLITSQPNIPSETALCYFFHSAAQAGSDAVRQFATGTFEAFADLSFDLKSRFVAEDGKWGAMEWVWHGRQRKDFPGLPATNKPFQVRGATVVEFRDGKISRNSDYWDLATYKTQVGLTK